MNFISKHENNYQTALASHNVAVVLIAAITNEV